MTDPYDATPEGEIARLLADLRGHARALADGARTLGLPGRATGGAVSPGTAYVVGENGPEVFVPTSAGSVASNSQLASRNQSVQVAINVASPAGGDTAQSMQRSTRQIAAAIRRALNQS
ncbi:MAG TPA: hypothetical protein VN222_05770 [Novosphingobium sp.]|nr:hypothetical protein [Novosphingobium sp.]